MPDPVPAAESVALDYLLEHYRPHTGTWDDTKREILERECMCCGEPGHYQRQLEACLAEHGLDQGVCLGPDQVWDGHHRIIAARRLGITRIPLEDRPEADARWLRDHGPIAWEDRKKGDRMPHERALLEGS